MSMFHSILLKEEYGSIEYTSEASVSACRGRILAKVFH